LTLADLAPLAQSTCNTHHRGRDITRIAAHRSDRLHFSAVPMTEDEFRERRQSFPLSMLTIGYLSG
jgi:hypothetical protein